MSYLLSRLKKQNNLPLCYAPFNNLIIDQQGNFKICCQNVKYSLGNYPEKKVDEIWFGREHMEIIKKFIDNEIPSACFNCIRDGLNMTSSYFKSSYFRKTNFYKKILFPYQVNFQIDNTCNLNCIMCSPNISTASTTDYTFLFEKANFSEEFFNQIKPILKNAYFFVFSGGEPFLIPIYSMMWEYIRENNSKATILIQTNGSILNDHIKRLLADFSFDISISIDSVTKESYEKIRRNASYNNVFNNIRYFIQYSKEKGKLLQINTTPMTINAMEIPKIVDFCNTNRIKFFFGVLERPVNLAIWGLPSKEIFQILETYKLYLCNNKSNDPIINFNINNYKSLINLIEKYANRKSFIEKNKTQILSKITEASHLFEINYKDILKRNVYELPIGNDKKKILYNRSIQLIPQLFEQFSRLFEQKHLFYSYFINKDLGFVINSIQKFDNVKIAHIFEKQIKEHAVFFETMSYDRIIYMEGLE